MRGKNIWIIGADHALGQEIVHKLSIHNRVAISGQDKKKLDVIIKKATPWEPIQNHPLDLSKTKDIEATIKILSKSWTQLDHILFIPPQSSTPLLEKITEKDLSTCVNERLVQGYSVLKSVETLFYQQGFGTFSFLSDVFSRRAHTCTTAADLGKSIFHNFAEATNLRWSKAGCHVKMIETGFVQTEHLSKETIRYPFLLSATEAAKNIENAMEKKCFTVHFPKVFTLPVKLIFLTPHWLYKYLFKGWQSLCKHDQGTKDA